MTTSTTTCTITLNGCPQIIPPGTTIAALLERLQLRAALVAVEVNAQLVPRQAHPQRVLNAGDCVEVVTLVGGG